MSFELPNGNGQEIYFDAYSLFFKPEWIDEEKKAIFMPDFVDVYPIYKEYRMIFDMLYKKGYKVICDGTKVNDDTFFFTPCFDKHINKTKEQYKDKLQEKVLSCLLNNGIEEPLSVSFPIDSFPVNIPALPFVLKNENAQCGNEKFLIRTKEQLELLKRFYYEINGYDRKKAIKKAKEEWGLGDSVEFYDDGHSNSPVSIFFVDYKEEFHKNMRLQKYVETPTEYNTSLRVLTSSSGEILGASLKYAETINQDIKKSYSGLFDKYLSTPNSPYYLGSEGIVSNTFSGGNSILLGKNNYSILEREILFAHDIDPFDACVPNSVEKAAVEVAVNCQHEIGALCGMDFIYDNETKQWKYLESHSYPMLFTYAEKYDIPYDSSDPNFHEDNQILDLNVRMHILFLTMEKKQRLSTQYIKTINK